MAAAANKLGTFPPFWLKLLLRCISIQLRPLLAKNGETALKLVTR
jgi:hypothetical protein